VPLAAQAGDCAACAWEKHDTVGHHAIAEEDLDAAEAAFASALEVARGFLAGDWRLIESLGDLALVARRRGDAETELSFRRQALDAVRDAEERLAFARLYGNEAAVEALDTLGRDAESEPYRLAALEDRRALFGAEDPELAVYLLDLASHYREMERIDDAIAAAEKAAAVRLSFAEEDDRPYAAALDFLAMLYVAAGRDGEAAAALASVLAIDEKHLGTDHVFVAGVIEQYVPILRRLGREAEADELEWRAMDIRARSEAPMRAQPSPETQ
ncbi:MAG: tetratricopeptide repeat protein, partial [Alphaproteobacteria bacterium]|nr:tetratricopeptide repeat protein [Alphaproteobacteria bacterium]